MPRSARIVALGVPHHITQRGTDRQHVFFSNADRKVYLRLLAEQSRLAGLRVLAYCLMRNHIHLVAVPDQERSLALAMQRTHGRYAQYLNARRQRCGHLWQNRYFSCPLAGSHLWTALRYVEHNPVRAGIVVQPWMYRWSSTAAHLGAHDESRALDRGFWREQGGAETWRDMIDCGEDESHVQKLRLATYAGRPLGSQQFRAEHQRRTAAAS